jgi:hypothetical protein
MSSRVAVCLLVASVCVSFGPALAADAIEHQLRIQLDPETGLLRVEDAISLESLDSEQNVEFLLNSALEIIDSNPAVERVPLGEVEGFYGINGTSIELSGEIELVRYRLTENPENDHFAITYAGEFDFGLSEQKEEYTRGFRETAGIISEEGVYLAGSGFWYPSFGDQLLSFEMDVKMPEDWHVISQGNGTAGSGEGKAHWSSGGSMDEIYLVGGPLEAYEEAAGAVSAQVFLRQADDALAAKYLTATAQYIEMYRNLVGPYPYEKFALVENFWETGYGMPSFTLLGPTVIRFPFILTSSYPHEILHNWWGNSVFVDYSTGNWCEGLTAYMADHLIQEQRGRGGEYRRGTLQKYRNYVKDSRDFPLSEFRSRHSAATEAVGYGKTLMGFHMLRLHLGDEEFRTGLATFYRRFRGKRASFADLQRVLEETSGKQLEWFFQPWVTRTGAAAFEVDVAAEAADTVITGVLRQVQTGDPFELVVPVAVQTAAGIETFDVRTQGRETPFEFVAQAPVKAVQVDPRFDTFRFLFAREIPPSIGQIFGEPEILALLPSRAPEDLRAAYRGLMEGWQSDSHSITVRLDEEVAEIPYDRAVWILGRENLHVSRLLGTLDSGLELGPDGAVLGADSVPYADHSLVVIRRHPENLEKAVGWLVVDPGAAFSGMGRKLPHYGKYSYLAFEGEEPTNIVKCQWPTGDSPLFVELRAESEQHEPLPPMKLATRPALIDLPPVFSQKRLMQHVSFLSSEKLQGRGAGSPGLQLAAEYIAEQFAVAGLEPGGDEDTFFQRFTLEDGPDSSPVELTNVIGILPGGNDDWKDQLVVVSAHYDHLGLGWPDVHAGDQGKAHLGADDNASGVAVMLELARAIADSDKPQRNLVFVAFSGEEAGRVGSKYFVEQPVGFSADGIRGIINLDTVGRMGEKPVSILGTGTAAEWQHIFRGASFVTGVESRNVPESAEASDQMSFIEKGIPGIQIFTSAHADYHRPGDTADKIDAAGLVKVATLTKEAVVYMSGREEPLTITIEPSDGQDPPAAAPSTGPASGRRVRFGTVPDFAFPGPGVKVEQVGSDSPAEAAGFQAGDVLIRINEDDVTDLRAYSQILRTLEPGQRVRATVLRAGEEVTLEVTVAAR